MEADTIVALGTPPGESGIAVVRLSGPEAIRLASGMVASPPAWVSHRAYKRTLRTDRGEHLDEAVVTVMRAPNSYTGEDVVEISCHGSMQAVSEILEEAMHRGARAATAGEFTRRAFLNGKLDLVQAEAVADLIASETRLQRRVALEMLEGGLSSKVRRIEDRLLDQLALVEVSIDFTEEDVETYDSGALTSEVGELRSEIRALLDSEVVGRTLRNGTRVTILGPRNAGKSSLYNALIGEERAIVSPVPGTTRDILRERIHINGFTYYLEDTAGIADTGCEIEARGMSIGRRAAGSAAMVLFVVDGSERLSAEAVAELRKLDPRRTLCVVNKSDLGLFHSPARMVKELGAGEMAHVSALTGAGLERLRKRIFERTVGGETGGISSDRIAINARHGAALREADEALQRLETALGEGAPAEILSMEIRAAADAAGKITGRSIVENLLDTIFGRFCIGK